ncbi:Matrix-remodeling-associated protein 7 [Merluccius polli]|uniref:Matrix-remodeling-associated protein 7 n=1 Tax=Merluccius polli TaxID=89951 RepID=A0AA47M691_MERPO|nr:Matrix-remodeling-associated protein 7 [Merluccius polli]
MDLTFILAAVIFTLLAVVVATSIFNGSPSSLDFARGREVGPADETKAGLDPSAAWLNGHIPDRRTAATDDWAEHDHWEVVKSVLSAESEETHRDTADAVHTLSASPLDPRCVRPSRSRSCDLLDSSSAAVSSPGAGGRRSLIGLSEKELLKCAFSYPQTEGATESPGLNDIKYLPGQARSKHIETMMSKQELEDEQRVQREQLAAIFRLLKDNKETFGEVSEGDLEDQFRLYSI